MQSTPNGIVYKTGPDKYGFEEGMRILAESADLLFGRLRIIATQAAQAATDAKSSAQAAAASAQAIANAVGLQPPNWTSVDARYSKLDSQVVNILDHGVKGDGVTDDTTAMQKMLTDFAGKTIWIPAGRTVKTTGILAPAKDTTITGGGKINSSATYAIEITESNVKVQGISFGGTGDTAIRLNGAAGAVIRECGIGSHKNGISAVANTTKGYWKIVDNVLTSALSTGIGVDITGGFGSTAVVQLEGNRFGGGFTQKASLVKLDPQSTCSNLGGAPGVQSGNTTTAAPAMGTSVAFSVTFPTAYPSPPVVTASPGNSRLNVGVATVTTTGFSGYVANFSTANVSDSGATIRWQSTPSIG